MKKPLLLLTFTTLWISTIFAQFYTVDLEPTGVSQLTILSGSITGLEVGDEIGIFDENAITNYNDCSNQIGELLVGTAVWDGDVWDGEANPEGTVLAIVSIGSVDNCISNSVQLAGYVEANLVLVKVYRPSTRVEYNTELTWGNGIGRFGETIQSVSEIELSD